MINNSNNSNNPTGDRALNRTNAEGSLEQAVEPLSSSSSTTTIPNKNKKASTFLKLAVGALLCGLVMPLAIMEVNLRRRKTAYMRKNIKPVKRDLNYIIRKIKRRRLAAEFRKKIKLSLSKISI